MAVVFSDSIKFLLVNPIPELIEAVNLLPVKSRLPLKGVAFQVRTISNPFLFIIIKRCIKSYLIVSPRMRLIHAPGICRYGKKDQSSLYYYYEDCLTCGPFPSIAPRTRPALAGLSLERYQPGPAVTPNSCPISFSNCNLSCVFSISNLGVVLLA